MKKFALAAAMLVFAACSPDLIKQDGDEQFGQFTGTFTLQGKVMNAQTGAPIGGDDLKIKLIQGTSVRDPNRLIKDEKDMLVGEYAFSDIPLSLHWNSEYKIVAVKDGYLRFESILDFGAYWEWDFPMLDSVYNIIGDIYLHPVGTDVPDVVVNVVHNGKPVPNAVVSLDPDGNWGFGTDSQYYALSHYYGYLAAQTATTDASGKATFPAAQLGLGVYYDIRVNPVVFEGIQLGANQDEGLYLGVVGYTNTPYIWMSEVTNGNAYGLYIADASNKAATLNSEGVLTIKFTRPVYISNLNGFTASVSGSYWGTAGTPASLLNPSVVAQLSGDKMTLTLTPQWNVRPADDARGVWVTFNASATIGVDGYPGTAYTLFGLDFADGSGLDNDVYVKAQ